MRLLEVVAHAFGPFRARRFQFAPGMTLVHGPNEAGKSSLQAAMVVGLCGLRRGKGRSSAELEFERRHRPWQGAGWKVSALVELEDGQRIELIQDLEDRAASRAHDAVRGRDLTSQIENEGTPDAARLLGLDRASFLATACVKQAELLAVRNDPAALQEYLQRGIDTSGSDATAAEALEQIETFVRERIGSRQTHSTKPLRRAILRVTEATQSLTRAQDEHRSYRQLLAREDEMVLTLEKARRELALTDAAGALSEAGALRRDVERAQVLSRRHPNGAPATSVESEERSAAVERALHAYAARPAAVHLEGPTAADLRRELAELDAATDTSGFVPPERDASAPSNGDAAATRRSDAIPAASQPIDRSVAERAAVATAARTQGRAPETAARLAAIGREFETHPAPEILEAAAQVRGLRRQMEEHEHERPPQPGPAPASGASAAQLRQLASRLEIPEPVGDQRLETRRRQLELQLVRARREARRWLITAVGCGIAGAPLAIAGAFGHGALVVGIVVLLVAAGLALVSLRIGTGTASTRADEMLREIESQLAMQRVRHEDWLAAHNDALRQVRRHELVGDPRLLHERAAARESWDRAVERSGAWDAAESKLRLQVEARTTELRGLLDARVVPRSADALADAAAYQKNCATRGRRRELETRLAQREQDEAGYARVSSERRAAESDLLEAARQCSRATSDPEVARAALEDWRATRRRRLESHEQARREWNELERILDGRPLVVLERDLAASEARAQDLASGFSPPEIGAAACDEVARHRARAWVRDAELALATLRGEIARTGINGPRVSEAEEELAAATRELERLQQLETTLLTTREFLQRAQERVHRDVAPPLAAAIRAHLPVVTSGRYDDVRVDPETLEIQVREPGDLWRQAGLLSHGTAEQIYLLLRVALVQMLVRRGEVSPLFLDDVTVHFDRHRKRAMLEMLHALSAERQIVLSTQEEGVLEWGRENLVGPRDMVLELEPRGAGA